MRNLLISLFLTGLACAYAAPVVVNGSFEQPLTNDGAFRRLFSVDTTISGWTVSAGQIDWIGTLWQSAEGDRNLDMAGDIPGTIHQDVAGFVLGESYSLMFALAGNPFAQSTKELRVNVLNGASTVATATYSFVQTGTSLTDMGWVQRSLGFISPIDGSLRLQFIGLTPGGSGPALDDVRLAETSDVPEPSTLSLFGSSLVAFILLRRAR